LGVKIQPLIDMHDSLCFKWDAGDLKAFVAHFTLIVCGSVSRQVCASFNWPKAVIYGTVPRCNVALSLSPVNEEHRSSAILHIRTVVQVLLYSLQ